MTWEEYEADLELRIDDLHGRVHRGAYRPQPSRRAYIDKADGKQRPLSIAALEDKIVQGATVMVLNAIYEGDFVGFSYGFRPGRGPDDALDALSTAIKIRKVNWILDADIQNFFGSVSREWLIRFLEHRIGDKRIIRLIQKWLRAGCKDDGIDRRIGEESIKIIRQRNAVLSAEALCSGARAGIVGSETDCGALALHGIDQHPSPPPDADDRGTDHFDFPLPKPAEPEPNRDFERAPPSAVRAIFG
jgi:hypothetical protein